jgi:hypothetical protein
LVAQEIIFLSSHVNPDESARHDEFDTSDAD